MGYLLHTQYLRFRLPLSIAHKHIIRMRLLESTHSGRFRLKQFARDIPPYAILSHTWGRCEEDEVTYADLQSSTGNNKPGYKKLEFCSEQVKADGLYYFWVDTCCINKSDNSELTEAINSMFKWYQNSARCYVYLSDVSVRTQDGKINYTGRESSFCNSRWFTRGWTLQELLAPQIVEFFSSECVRLGNKNSLKQEIAKITGITIDALEGRSLLDFSVEDRMLWIKNRQTIKEEDMAYCLLGIFNIFLPLIYGEGRQHAMGRLRGEINKSPKLKLLSAGKKIHLLRKLGKLILRPQNLSHYI